MVWFTSTITLKASVPGIGVNEVLTSPSEEPPLHIYKNEDDWLYVLEGAMTFYAGGQKASGKNGSVRFVPARDPAPALTDREPVFLVINTPGSFERMFERAPNTPEEAAEL